MIRLTEVPKQEPLEGYSFEYWMLRTLPPEYAEAAINEPARKLPYPQRRNTYSNPRRALVYEFRWADSPLGSSFWSTACNYSSGLITDLPPLEGD